MAKDMTVLVTISDDRSGRKDGTYSESQDTVLELFKKNSQFGIDKFAFWKWKDITETQFYRDNKTMLDYVDAGMNGRCYKPFIILEALKTVQDGDFVIYNDISREVWRKSDCINWNLFSLDVLKKLCIENGGILSATSQFQGNILDHTHENFTTERCINKMGMQEFRHNIQHASGMLAFQKCKRSVDFVSEWLYWNLIDECASLGRVRPEGDPLYGYQDFWHSEGAAGKIGHRHDQSISGLLINKLKNNLVVELQNYSLLQFCVKDRVYEFFNTSQSPTKYKLMMRDGTVYKIARS